MLRHAAQIAVLVFAVMSSVVFGQTPASKNDETKFPPAKVEHHEDGETFPILRQSIVVLPGQPVAGGWWTPATTGRARLPLYLPVAPARMAEFGCRSRHADSGCSTPC